jgi:Bacterial PH domain
MPRAPRSLRCRCAGARTGRPRTPGADKGLSVASGRGFRERRRGEHRVVLRAWRMPIISALVWGLVCPLSGAVLLYGVYAAVVRRETEPTVLVFGAATVVGWLVCLLPAVRSLAARVVADPDGLAVHNALGTVRVAWSDVEDVEVIVGVNAQAIVNRLWYGVTVRIRDRRRPLRILASWVRREDYARAFADRLRSLAVGASRPPPLPR